MPTATQLTLAELHRQRGARWTTDDGFELPADYGDPLAESAALRQGGAIWDASAAGRLEMTGEDRHRFLNGLVTADVLQLEPGSSRYGLFTTIKGRVLADFTAIVDTDRIWLRLPPGRDAAIRQHMERYIITDRVELGSMDEVLPIVVAGPEAESRLAGWSGGSPPVEPGSHRTMTVQGKPVRVLREERLGVAAFSIWVAASVAAELITDLLAGAEPPTLVGFEAIETTRIAAGVARFGVDFGDDTFPQEADLDSAVSYEKGCYLGQEVVARIHFRGGVNRVLRGLTAAGDVEVGVGTRLTADGREIGRVTSFARTESGDLRALAMLVMAAAEPGGRVRLESGDVAEVVALPFSPA